MSDYDIVKAQVEFSWHGSGCATNVGPEDGGGYCTQETSE